MWDAVDLAATTVFTAMILGVALVLHTYDSLPAGVAGAGSAAVSYAGLRRALRVTEAPKRGAQLLAFALVISGALTSSGLGAQDARDPVETALARRIDEARQGRGPSSVS